MAKVLTENQELLAEYLVAIGCSKGTVFRIVTDLWDEEAVIEMLEFCRDNHPAPEAVLLEMSSKIYSKYKTRIESLPETDEE